VDSLLRCTTCLPTASSYANHPSDASTAASSAAHPTAGDTLGREESPRRQVRKQPQLRRLETLADEDAPREPQPPDAAIRAAQKRTTPILTRAIEDEHTVLGV